MSQGGRVESRGRGGGVRDIRIDWLCKVGSVC